MSAARRRQTRRPSLPGWSRPIAGGGIAAFAVLLLGGVLERVLIGADDAAAARAVREITAEVSRVDAALARAARDLAGRAEVRDGLTGDLPAVRTLFDVLRTAAGGRTVSDLAITIYDARALPRAWHGRPAELRPARLLSGPAGFADVGPAGLRLVHVEPIAAPAGGSGPPARRLGTVVVERVVSSTRAAGGGDGGFAVPTSVGRAVLHPGGPGAGGPRVRTFAAPGADGTARTGASIDLDEVDRVRARWRRRVAALCFLVLAGATLGAAGRVLAGRTGRRRLRPSAIAAAAAVAGGGWLWLAGAPDLFAGSLLSTAAYRSLLAPRVLRTAADLLLAAAVGAALVAIAADAVHRRRWFGPARRAGFWIALPGAVLPIAALLGIHHRLLQDTVDGAALDLLHTSLQPFDPARAALQLALVLASASTVWAAALVMGIALARGPVRPRPRRAGRLPLLVLAPAGLAAAAGWAPLAPSLLLCLPGGVLAFRGRRLMRWLRRADPVSRLLAALCAILGAAPPLYLSLTSLTDEAKRRLVETSHAVRAAEHPRDLHRQLDRALEEIDAELDARPAPPALPASPDGSGAGFETAFRVWSRTALAAARLTSAVEIFGADGELRSRFALNIPDAVTAARWTGTGCEWEVFGEVAPFGSEERRMLHAERGFCESGGGGPAGAPAGGVVVHVTQVDYESLPFIASRSPYVEPSATGRSGSAPGYPGHEVELVIYGWGRQPAFLSDRSAWPIDDALFQRIYASRDPFWTRLVKDSRRYEVFITNTRAGIYAIGYPARTAFDHLLHLSEIALLVLAAAGAAALAAVLAALVLPRLRRRSPYREVRTRFALKLQMWFVGAATAPVVVVAVLVQGYFADQLRADVEAGAVRAAAVARSVIEESVLVPSPDGQIITRFTDDILVRISQVIGQDVNVFDGPRLVATSTRDLYASGVLSTRTPDRVYRAIALDRLPNFVSEEAAGSLRHQLAAAPVRVGGRELILTAPLASRQREIEGQIDELNRRVLGSALFFAAVVGFIGWTIARGIANPVKRLTRATSRVARGEFGPLVPSRHADRIEKRVAARSADELVILEADFNRMAAELDARRRQLERTHRLEAWTEMARQVAHEIKNPLTPVQLSAEHLLRVHADRGAPLTPVLQGCVESILKQVRILRQIASEFSSYASSPAVRRSPTDLAALVHEVVAPYRPGLEGRIALSTDLPDLPRLQLDPVLMQRAITNIIENALHAMPDEGTLAIRAAPRGGEAQLTIRDTGVGLEPDVLARIFEPYFSTRITGTGLGMAIAKRNVELNGGAIAVASEPGRGTTVTMTLPIAAAPGRPAPPPRA